MRTREQGQATRRAVEAAGGSALVLAADLADAAVVASLDLGAIDVLVHNAAAYAPYARVEDGDAETDLRVLQVGLSAGLGLARRVLPGMRARGFGRLLFIGSSAAYQGAAGQAAYAATKAGLVGLTRSLAVEAGRHGVTCNLVEPGLVETPRLLEVTSAATREAILAASAVGRIGRPEEIAALVGFLASDQAGFVTGARLPVDGGLGLGVVPRESRPRPQGEQH